MRKRRKNLQIKENRWTNRFIEVLGVRIVNAKYIASDTVLNDLTMRLTFGRRWISTRTTLTKIVLHWNIYQHYTRSPCPSLEMKCGGSNDIAIQPSIWEDIRCGRYLLRAFSMNFQRHSSPFRDLGDDVNVVSPNHLPTQLYMMQLKVSRCLTRMATDVVLTYNVPTIRRDWMTVECRFAVFATFDQRIWHATGPLHLLAIWDVNRLCHPPGQIEFMILWWGPTVRNNNGKRGATVALVARCPSSYSIPFHSS